MSGHEPRVAHAWVESGLQFLNAVEYAHEHGVELAVHPRRGVRQLDATIAALRSALPATISIRRPRSHAILSPWAWAKKRILGDGFSGQLRLALLVPRRSLVLIDDGSIMVDLLCLLATQAPLRRPGQREGPIKRWLGGRASRRLSQALRHGDLEIFTAYADHEAAQLLASKGAQLRPNRFRWLRQLPGEASVQAESIVVGSALAVDGYVDTNRYAEWVRETAEENTLYMPHRRESPEFLDYIEHTLGVSVYRGLLPLEVEAAMASRLRRVIGLPSSVVASLKALGLTSVSFEFSRVPEEWWLETADFEFRSFINGLVDGPEEAR